ncbi:MAG: MurR/RpiR family transcriptional regulator [Mobilitalea sp.]
MEAKAMDLINPDVSTIVQIRAKYDSFSVSEKKVADYILAHSSDIIYESITNLAKYCGVSETSVIRLCKQIGYAGFQEMKINLAKSSQSNPEAQIHESIQDSDTIEDMIKKVMVSNILAIEETMAAINSEQVQKAIQAIAQTKRLEFYGLGGSGPVALDAQHKFFKYGISCIAYSDPHMQAMSAATTTKGDVVVAISNSGRSKDLVDSLVIAKEAGATTICITGGYNSPITKVSDYILMAVSREQSYKPEPMSSRIAQLSVVDVLSIGVALAHKDVVLNNLQKTRKSIVSKRYER